MNRIAETTKGKIRGVLRDGGAVSAGRNSMGSRNTRCPAARTACGNEMEFGGEAYAKRGEILVTAPDR